MGCFYFFPFPAACEFVMGSSHVCWCQHTAPDQALSSNIVIFELLCYTLLSLRIDEVLLSLPTLFYDKWKLF